MATISRPEALTLIASTSRYAHALLVGSLMRRLARRLGADEDVWELVGLLHDLDYDHTIEDVSQHGIVASEQLQGRLDDASLHAIRSHDYHTGVKPTTTLDIALIVADATAAAITQIGDEAPCLETLRAAIEACAIEKPWIPTLMRRCDEIGIGFEELLIIALSS